MDLFTLSAKLTMDTSEFDDKVSGAEQKGSSLGNALSGVGNLASKGMAAVGTAAAAAVTAVSGLAKSAIDAYANYEQLTGGVETLFGESAGLVMEYASNAYKTAGMSANQYMEQVTSFSASLLQSCAGDTAEAARVADMAMTDMSDNANKMGTSMEAIQNAYQGFAKGNYTMLDNLKLGYGGTAKEMKRLLSDAQKLTGVKYNINNLSDVYEAIHVIQEELGITGTTAEEAGTTIQGSITAMQAAWENLKVAMVDPNADIGQAISDMVETGKTALSNLIPAITQALTGIGTALAEIAPVISAELPGLIADVLPSMITAASSLLEGFITALTSSAPTIIAGAVTIITQLATALVDNIDQIVEAAGQILDAIIQVFQESDSPVLQFIGDSLEAIKNVASTVIGLFTDFPGTIQKLKDSDSPVLNLVAAGLETVKSVLDWCIGHQTEVALAVGAIVAAFTIDKIAAFVANLNPVTVILGLVAAAALLIVENWESIKATVIDIWESIKTAASDAWETIKSTAEELWPGISQIITSAIETAKSTLTGFWTTIKSFAQTIWDGIKSAAETTWNAIKDFITNPIESAKSTLTGFWTTIKSFAQTMWEGIQSSAETIWNAIKGFIENPINAAKSSLEGLWNQIKLKAKAIWDEISATADSVWKSIEKFISDPIGSARDSLNKIWINIRDAAKRVWDTILDWISPVIEGIVSVIDTVSSAVQSVIDWFNQLMGYDGKNLASTTSSHTHTTYQRVVNASGEEGWNSDSDQSLSDWYLNNHHAKGAWNIPYNDYPALLHRGEMVLTASQARRYRDGEDEGVSGVGIGSLSEMIVAAIREGLQNAEIPVYMDGQRVTDEVNRHQGADFAARRYAV